MTDLDPNEPPGTDEHFSSVAILRRDWKTSWQAPALIVALALFVGAILYSVVTAPKPDLTPAIERAERLIERGSNQEALDVLKSKIRPYLDKSGEASALGRRYHLGVARALYRAQAELGIDMEVNHRNVLSNYLESERQGAELLAGDQFALAQTYLSLGETTAARIRADSMPDEAHEMRVSIYRRLIDLELARPAPKYDQVLETLSEILGDPTLPPDDRAWALARQTQIRLDQGYTDEAITRLLRASPRVEEASPAARGELRLLLGRAYVSISALSEGERQLEKAQELLLPGSPLLGETLYYLSKVDEFRGDSAAARDRLAFAVERYPESRTQRQALMALGEAEAALGQIDQSRQVYKRLVDEINTADGQGTPGPDEASESLLSRYRERLARDEIDEALAFATLAGEMFPLERLPAEVLASLATAHRRSGEEIIAMSGTGGGLDSLDPSSRAEAQRHLIRAASYYRLHAEAFILSDNEQYARSLWLAADLFDQSGDRGEAIEAFRMYAEGVPGDGRNAEARFRLGRAFQSMGDNATAASYFRDLIDQERLGLAADVGQFAELSYVPLAQTLLDDGDESNDEEAKLLLRRMISGSMGDAETVQYRRALIEIGRVEYSTGDYERAIEHLEEARARYPEDKRITEIRFMLADAYRLSARQIEDRLSTEAMPGSTKRQLKTTARDRRIAAMAGYEQVVGEIEQLDPRARSALTNIQLRNSYFFLGDCAFDLGEFSAAIMYYDRARERYPQDPSSLVAMVQIVNAHIEEGDMGRARTANERARRFYDSLPEKVWDDPNLPMGRRDWERWLDSSSRLYEVSAATTD